MQGSPKAAVKAESVLTSFLSEIVGQVICCDCGVAGQSRPEIQGE